MAVIGTQQTLPGCLSPVRNALETN